MVRTIYLLSQQANKWDLFNLKSVIIMVRTIYLLSQQVGTVSKRTFEINHHVENNLLLESWDLFNLKSVVIMVRTIYLLSQQVNKWDLFNLKSVEIYFIIESASGVRFV